MTTLAGRKIKRHRLKQTPKLTMQAFGAAYGAPRATVQGWEDKGKIAVPETVNRIAADGIASHADWYHPAECPRCEAESDSAQAERCEREHCPLRARAVA